MLENEQAQIAAWQRGDEQAGRAVFECYYPRAVRLAVLSGLTQEEALDCAQDVFMRAFEHRLQLRDPATFPLWFHRITTRQILTMLKARQRRTCVPLEQVGELDEDWARTSLPQPDEMAISAESRQHLWRQVQALSPTYRLAIVLRYYGDFSLREVADLLGQREGTVRVTLHRALQILRQGSPEPSVSAPAISAQSARTFAK
ncbi:MAG TPA: RNA polymerase sigma factor [Ktedonobacteraceae bacterium]|jgi:RNA polymerase sigma-70 factor (ECF subfamily)